MDIYQARRTNLLRLIDDEFDGNQTAFAVAVGVKPLAEKLEAQGR